MKTELFSDVQKGAVISPCGTYRFRLWRIWNSKLPYCLFIMHNPSTADANEDDPTIRRCINFAKDMGCGGIYVGNLSPYRATDPKDLLKVPVHLLVPHQNKNEIVEMAAKCSMHVLAFGNPIYDELKIFLPNIGSKWYALKVNKSGNPGHPLYLKKDLALSLNVYKLNP